MELKQANDPKTETTAQKILNLIDLHMNFLQMGLGNRKKAKIYLITSLIHFMRFLQVLFAVMLILQSSDNFLRMARGAATIGVNLQGLKIIGLWNEKEMIFLIKSMDRFWYSEEIEKIYANCLKFCRSFRVLVYSAYTAIVIVPIFFGAVPVAGAYPQFPGSFWVFALMQAVQFLFDATVAVCVECSFLSFSFFLYAQLVMLSKRLLNITANSDMHTEIKLCIDHHNFLLDLLDIFHHTFTWCLLVQFAINNLGICVEIFVFDKQPNAIGIVASIFYIMALSAQLAIYCFPAELLINECHNVSHAIYNALWYDHPKFSKTYVQNIIQRGNKHIVITGGRGMIYMNRAAFTNIFKWTLSFYTLMRDMDRHF